MNGQHDDEQDVLGRLRQRPTAAGMTINTHHRAFLTV